MKQKRTTRDPTRRNLVLGTLVIAALILLVLTGSLKGIWTRPLLTPQDTLAQCQQELAELKKDRQQPTPSPAKPTPTKKPGKTSVRKVDPKIEALVKSKFPQNHEVMKAIFIAESGLNPKAQGWNCRYGKVTKACKPEDRHLATSVDCGVAQINHQGKECPAYLFDPEKNLEVAQGKYLRQGYGAWVVYKTGAYRRYL